MFVRGFIDTTGRIYGFKGYSIFAIFLPGIWDKLSILRQWDTVFNIFVTVRDIGNLE